jgi:hypothetical protein
MQAATKRYVDVQAAAALPLSGGALTGPLTLPTNPAAALHAAPKQYVDSQVASALPVVGGTLTGALTLAGDPASPLHAATKRYVDAAGGGSTGVINVRSAPIVLSSTASRMTPRLSRRRIRRPHRAR